MSELHSQFELYWRAMKSWHGSPANLVGVFSFLSAFSVLGIWYILLFVANPPNLSATQSASEQLHFVFSAEDPHRGYFVWLALLPLLSVIIGTAYLFNLARSRAVAALLLISTLILGIVDLAFTTWYLAIFVLLPAFWGWRCVRSAPSVR
jgi:hypothetical protein